MGLNIYTALMWHPKTVEFDNRMKELFDEVDHHIEDLYGDMYNLHPVRPKRGETSNPEADGLFNVGAVFSPGFNSRLGRGYIIEKKILTLDHVDPLERRKIYEVTADKVRELLPKYFPGREFSVECDGKRFRILGDFSLGEA